MAVHRFISAAATLLIVALAGIFTPGLPAQAGSADDFRWTVLPSDAKGPTGRSQFVYDLEPGQRLQDHVAVKNLSSRPLDFSVYATDAYTTVDGAFALPPASETPNAAGTWLGLNRKTHRLGPGRQLVLPFQLSVPPNAAPGDHAAGVIASVSAPGTSTDGQRVNVDRRVAARVYLRVGGPLQPRTEVESVVVDYGNPWIPFTRGQLTVNYRVRNTGNVRLGGTVRVHATGMLGVPLSGTEEVTLPELLPGATVALTERLDRVLPAGLVTGVVDLDVSSAGGEPITMTRTRSTWTVPWMLAYPVLLGIAVLTYTRRRRLAALLRRARPRPDTSPPR